MLMHASLRRISSQLAETLLIPHLHECGYLQRVVRDATVKILPAPTRLHGYAQTARAAEELVDPSKPVEGPLLEEPQEPGPEDCCQVFLLHQLLHAR